MADLTMSTSNQENRLIRAVEELVESAQALIPPGDKHTNENWTAELNRLEWALRTVKFQLRQRGK